jgi:hypothetical protein
LHTIIERWYPSERILSFGADAQESVREFTELPETRRGEIHVLKGHMGFGLHEFMPQPSTYITIMRDPIDRTISYYHHILRKPDHYLHQEVVSEEMSLKEVVCGEMTPDMDNGQTRLLSGVWNTVPCGHCSTDMLERAKRNLREYFAVVGLVERFDETLMLLKKTFGWGVPFYVRANVTPNRPSKASLSQDVLAAIEKYNDLDIELYEYARQLFQQQIVRYGGSFAVELQVFRSLNRAYGGISRLLTRASEVARDLKKASARLG